MLVYRAIFSLIPLFLMPLLNYSMADTIIVVAVMLVGVLLGQKSHRVSRIQNLTYVLFFVLLVIGYLQDRAATLYRNKLVLLAFAQGVSGFYGLFHRNKYLSIAFAISYWIMVGTVLAQISLNRLGTKGIFLAVALIFLVAVQDLRRILKPITGNEFEREVDDR